VTFDRPAAGVLVAHLIGELDLSNAPKLDEVVEEQLSRSRPRRFVLDLAGLEFIDLRGVAVLARVLRRTVACDAHLYLAAVSPRVVRALKLAEFLSKFDRIPDPSYAVPPGQPA
jgi:anti-sigma B factor antagonist